MIQFVFAFLISFIYFISVEAAFYSVMAKEYRELSSGDHLVVGSDEVILSHQPEGI
jgi:hypothetical protein